MRRRTWLALGAGSALALAVAGGSVALLAPALSNAKLTSSGREVFRAVARGVLDGTLPRDATQDQSIAALLDRIDALIANLPPHAQGELAQLLALLASAPGRVAFAGLSPPWSEATVAQVQASLESMRGSGIALRQQAFLALREIVNAAYFSEPSTWAVLGYPGPLTI